MKKFIGFVCMFGLVGCLIDLPHGASPPDGILRITVAGDSNTKFGCTNPSPTWPHCDESVPSWVDCLNALDAVNPLNTQTVVSGHQFNNQGLGGSSACDPNFPFPFSDFGGDVHMPYILDTVPDVVILAYGTNDLFYGFTPSQIVDCYQALYHQIAVSGAIPFIALTPPEPGRAPTVTDVMVQDLNTRLVAAFGTRQTIDFYTGVTSDALQADGVHVTDAEQHRRAQIVYDALQAWPNR